MEAIRCSTVYHVFAKIEMNAGEAPWTFLVNDEEGYCC
jgi:hypothetical protein